VESGQLELKQLLEMQRNFDRKMGWNTYEKCRNPEDILDLMEHFVCVMVEELGEIARARKEFLRDKQKFDAEALKHELVDLFVYLMQGAMALNMDLEKEYRKKMRTFKTRFLERSKL
jgi:NTP pyrophosphatase (non-canonical NTP hydrolase)